MNNKEENKNTEETNTEETNLKVDAMESKSEQEVNNILEPSDIKIPKKKRKKA